MTTMVTAAYEELESLEGALHNVVAALATLYMTHEGETPQAAMARAAKVIEEKIPEMLKRAATIQTLER